MKNLKCLMVLLSSCLVLLNGCAGSKCKYIHESQSISMQRAEFMPREYELKYNRSRVAIIVTDKTKDVGTNANLKTIFENAIERHISDTGTAQIVSLDAGQNKELEKLIDKATSRSTKPVSERVDYAIWAVISSIELDSEYIDKAIDPIKATFTSINKTKKPKSDDITESKCQYSATITGTLRIYGLAEEQIIRSYNISATSSDSKDTTSSSCLITSSIVNLIRKSAKTAIEKKKEELQNFFPPKGYIKDRKICNEKSYFKISLGKKDLMEPGLKVEIYTKYTDKDPLTNEINLEEAKVAEGKIDDNVENNYAWIILDDEERADEIRLGDYGKIIFKKSMFDRMINVWKKRTGL